MTKKHWSANFKRKGKERRTDTESGITFDSVQEKRRYQVLLDEQKHGLIRNLQVHVAYPLQWNSVTIRTPTGRIAKYTADFVYVKVVSTVEVIEDVKGYSTKESELRIAVFEALYGKKVTIIKKRRG